MRVYCFPRHNRDGGVARWSAQEERRARQRLRTQVGRLLGLMNADVGGGISVEAAEVVEIPTGEPPAQLALAGVSPVRVVGDGTGAVR
ncbi:hypothetical protein OG413_16885 [Streptomyces sp. NBC_01433]|uniref:hypothetical protein n=1 Tax=Streptomyces sp. NBC_01433 TaxID=2903864 RepID=UPI002251056C|nr:hypothetical protein [Streptomyces sp. NBC_01433]MCX4676958.1 hypothetical protein [Streptomyces sp. NBC_01433]